MPRAQVSNSHFHKCTIVRLRRFSAYKCELMHFRKDPVSFLSDFNCNKFPNAKMLGNFSSSKDHGSLPKQIHRCYQLDSPTSK